MHKLLHELVVGRDRVVADGLDRGAAEVGAHVLEGDHAIFADLKNINFCLPCLLPLSLTL